MPRALAGFLALALLIDTSRGQAGVCGVGQFSIVLPGAGHSVPRNGLILVDADNLRAALLEHAELRFVSASSAIPARVVKRLSGGRDSDGNDNEVQLLLAPTSDFVASTTYHLSIGDGAALTPATPADQRVLADMNSLSQERFSFTSLAERDDSAPHWNKPPTVGGYTYDSESKGIFRNAVTVHVPLGKAFAGFVLAQIKPIGKPDRARAVLFAVNAETTQIGQTACYSMFYPSRGNYRVTLTAVALGGNEAPAPGKPIRLWFDKSS